LSDDTPYPTWTDPCENLNQKCTFPLRPGCSHKRAFCGLPSRPVPVTQEGYFPTLSPRDNQTLTASATIGGDSPPRLPCYHYVRSGGSQNYKNNNNNNSAPNDVDMTAMFLMVHEREVENDDDDDNAKGLTDSE
jgi:hypothetical protein